MGRTTSVKGTIDSLDDDEIHIGGLADRLRVLYRQFGYQPVSPPILEAAGPFLDRSGEEIRRRMYIFSDPSGREVCLRPEITIPATRLFAEHVLGNRTTYRAYYMGPVFRFDNPAEGRYRQFTQAGVEFFGETDREFADAEALTVAIASMEATGLAEHQVVVSDIGFFVAAAKDPRVSEGLSQQIRRSAGDPERLAALLGRLAGDGATLASHVATTTEAGSEVEREATLDELVAQLPASLRGDLLDVVLGATDHSSSGIRTADEIAQRLLSRAARRPVEALDPAVSHVFAELLGIDLPVTEGLALIRALATESENDALHELCDSWDRRVRLFEAHGIDSAQVLLRPRLRRGIDYYSSFIFEIHDRSGSKVSQICAGGRYDDLVGKLSGREDVPAVGFALGLERLARRVPRSPTVPLVDAVVVGGGDVPQEACVEVTTALRAAGFRAQLLTGHRVRYALRSALRDGIRFLVLVGEEEQANGKVSLRDLDRKTQIEVSVDDLLTHLQSELDRG